MIRRSALLVVGMGLVGCDAEPTFSREISPILASQCAPCHRSDGVAPFPLETYEDAQAHAGAIAAAVESGKMPPWPAVVDDDCPTLEDARGLTPDQIDLITRWVDGGAPRGAEDVAPPSLAPARWLTGPTIDVAPAEVFVPDPSLDEYRCFVLDPGLTEDAYLTAYAVGGAQGIHHLHVWSLDDDVQAAKAEEVDAEQPGSGFPCKEGGAIGGRHLTVWGPTDPVRRHPPGTGVRLLAGKKLMTQIHFHHAVQPSEFFLALEVAPTVEQVAELITVGPAPFVLPPREDDLSVTASTIAVAPALLWGARAHMHGLGKAAHVTLTRDGASRCLLEIPRWDEKWQLMYFYREPIPVLPGDLLKIECVYDTTSRTEDTVFGPTADDEMCNANFFVTK